MRSVICITARSTIFGGRWEAGARNEVLLFTMNAIHQLKADLVLVAGGFFTMGCTAEQGYWCDADEHPAHDVHVASFLLGRTPVTVACFREFILGSGYRTTAERKGGVERVGEGGTWEFARGVDWEHHTNGRKDRRTDDDRPVVHVSWEDARMFCEWLSRVSGHVYRLPTEAEWEFAARGGIASRHTLYAGGQELDGVGWYAGNSGGQPHPVGSKAPNELGLYDMSGNVWEWCQDRYREDHYSRAPLASPTGPATGDGRVLRGGAWGYPAHFCRVSTRLMFDERGCRDDIGFRIAKVG